jgi:hypothetical protein
MTYRKWHLKTDCGKLKMYLNQSLKFHDKGDKKGIVNSKEI